MVHHLHEVIEVIEVSHRSIDRTQRRDFAISRMQKSKLSRRIAGLEDQLGARLIHRSSRRFSVTEIGQAYYQHCLAMLVEAEAAQAVIDNVTAQPRGVIRVACTPGLLTYQMGGLIARFMALYPEVEVHLHSASRRVDVIGEGFDLAIRVREPCGLGRSPDWASRPNPQDRRVSQTAPSDRARRPDGARFHPVCA